MNWLKTLVQSRKEAEICAKKAGVTLKPRHFRKLQDIWAHKYLTKHNYSLTALFEVEYAERMQEMYQAESPLLKLMKHDYNFYGEPVCIPISLSMEKIP